MNDDQIIKVYPMSISAEEVFKIAKKINEKRLAAEAQIMNTMPVNKNDV